MERRRISSGTEWEPRAGYSRAVRAGSQVHVSGTTATDDRSEVVGEGDPSEQTKQALANVEDALAEAGAPLECVVRTRLFVTDIDDWETIGEAHGEYFGEIRPATSMLEVNQLLSPDLLVEIETVAAADG
ncbi:MAG: RidA family protein [Halobellus sp.]|uniref:RidA family protein n=1 Tax=Halobellus sp. TaxID=1979212 RepID=UPI0035D4448F